MPASDAWKKKLRVAVNVKQPASVRSALRAAAQTRRGFRGSEAVFVAISSYADGEVYSTLRSMLTKAADPSKIRVGLVFQGDERDAADPAMCPFAHRESLATLAEMWGVQLTPSTASRFCPAAIDVHDVGGPTGARKAYGLWEHLGGRVREVRLPKAEAAGPCWARYVCGLLWRCEEFQLQIDSHMRFRTGWDATMAAEFAQCEARSRAARGPAAKACISTYGRGYEHGAPFDQEPRARGHESSYDAPLVCCAHTYDEHGALMLHGRSCLKAYKEPPRAAFWSANFSYGRGEQLVEVGYDPRLRQLFYGEEISYAVRLYTHGYDIYVPTAAHAHHLWDKSKRACFDDKPVREEIRQRETSRYLIRRLLGVPPTRQPTGGVDASAVKRIYAQALSDAAKADARAWPRPGGDGEGTGDDGFGLGKVRTLKEFEAFGGVIFGARAVLNAAHIGGIPPALRDNFEDEATKHDNSPAANALHQADLADSAVHDKDAGPRKKRGSGGPLAFLEAADRGAGIQTIRDALPAAFAAEVAAALRAAPETAWEVVDTYRAALLLQRQRESRVLTSEDGDEAEASLQDMLYSRLKEGFAGVDRDAVAKHAARALRLRSHERLLLNFSKYKPGDFLSSHTDSPSGSPAYERKRAWVWHLSDEGWDGEALGGNFLDEVTGVQYAPVYNAIVHFEVPRRHSVEKVLSGAPNRYAAYGWVVTAQVALVRHLKDVPLLASQAEVGVVAWLGEEPEAHAAEAKRVAAAAMERIGFDRCRAEFARFAVCASAAVAAELGLPAPPSLGVVRWGAAVAASGKSGSANDLKKAVAASRAATATTPLPVPPAAAADAAADAAAGRAACRATSPEYRRLARFVDAARRGDAIKRLDPTDQAGMVDMYFSKDTKIFVFVPEGEARFDTTLRALQKKHAGLIRIFACDPRQCAAILEDFKLGPGDAPTACAHDTQITGQRWLMRDHTWGAHVTDQTLGAFVDLVAAETRKAR